MKGKDIDGKLLGCRPGPGDKYSPILDCQLENTGNQPLEISLAQSKVALILGFESSPKIAPDFWRPHREQRIELIAGICDTWI
jgi:hypothetical protein